MVSFISVEYDCVTFKHFLSVRFGSSEGMQLIFFTNMVFGVNMTPIEN